MFDCENRQGFGHNDTFFAADTRNVYSCSSSNSSNVALLHPTVHHQALLEECLVRRGMRPYQRRSLRMSWLSSGTGCRGNSTALTEGDCSIRHFFEFFLHSIVFGSLVEKERLLGELMRSQKEFESMKHSFEHRLQVFGFCLFVCFLFYFISTCYLNILSCLHYRKCKAQLAVPLMSVIAFLQTWSALNRCNTRTLPQKGDIVALTRHQSVEGATASERERFTAKLKALEGEQCFF
jgi:hypothetical protein